MKKTIILLMIMSGLAFADDPVEVWARQFDDGNHDEANAIVLDLDDEVLYVAGASLYSGNNFNTQLIKYDTAGNYIWDRQLDLYQYDKGYDAALLSTGDVYVSGMINGGFDNDYLLVRYNPTGDTVWTRVYNCGGLMQWNDEAYGVAVNLDYVYLTGYYHTGSDFNIRTLTISHEDSIISIASYGDEDTTEIANDIFVDRLGNSYVCGNAGGNQLLVAYDDSYDTLWTARNGTAGFNDALDVVQYDTVIFTTGTAGDSLSIYQYHYLTGELIDSLLYAGGYADARGYDIKVDANFIYVAGYAIQPPSDPEGQIWCFDWDFNLMWKIQRPDFIFTGLEIDYDGYLYATGTTTEAEGDIWTIKYDLPFEKSITVLTPNGHEELVVGQPFEITWDFYGEMDSVVIEYSNESTDGLDTIAVTSNTKSYMWTVPDTPGEQTWLMISDVANYADVKDSTNSIFSIVSSAVEEPSSERTLSPQLALEISHNGLIRYQVPSTRDANLTIYAVDGSLVHWESISSSNGESQVDNLVSGVYFARLTVSNQSIITKVVLTR